MDKAFERYASEVAVAGFFTSFFVITPPENRNEIVYENARRAQGPDVLF